MLKMTQAECDRLQKLYIQDGLTPAEIAAKLNYSERTVWARLKAYGLSRRLRKYIGATFCPACGQLVSKGKRKHAISH